MKLFNGKNARVLIASLGLLAGAGAAHADTESGQVKLINYVTGFYSEGSNAAGVVMASPDPLGTGRCSGPMQIDLNGEASKATVATLLAASVAGSSVTVHYVYSSEDDSCLFAAVQFN